MVEIVIGSEKKAINIEIMTIMTLINSTSLLR